MAGMSDKVNEPACKQEVLEIASFIIDAKAEDVQILDISVKSGFADYFILATVNSFGQLRGLAKNVEDELLSRGIHARGVKKSYQGDETWVLLDCDDFIIHLMTKPAREFYALEKLWFDSPRIDVQSGLALG